MPERIIVREATERDLDALVELGRRTFADTFAADNTPDDLNSYLNTALSRELIAAEMTAQHSTFLLAFAAPQDAPIGYAKYSTGAPIPERPEAEPLEIERLYVDRPALGQGAGAVLMRAMLAVAETQRSRSVWLGVWEHNQTAIRFYERWGFTVVGEKSFMFGSERQRDLVMLKKLE